MSEPTLNDRSLFRQWAQETCRYGDTDRQGHINNATFATFCETGRVTFMGSGETALVPDGCEVVIVRLTLDFRAELQWGQVVDIGSACLRIGTTSFVMGQGLFHGDRCVATAECILVLLDSATRRPTPLTPKLRARLADIVL